jgi:hypothetical protein
MTNKGLVDLEDLREKLFDQFQHWCHILLRKETRETRPDFSRTTPDLLAIGQISLVRERLAGDLLEGLSVMERLRECQVGLSAQQTHAKLQDWFTHYMQAYGM